jgi:hypothetical protein
MMNAHSTPTGTDWNGLLGRIEQTESQISTLEALLADKRGQLHSDLATLEKQTRPEPNPPTILACTALDHCDRVAPATSRHVLIFKGGQHKCRYYKDLLIRLCRQIREEYPDQWGAAVASLNSACSATLRVAQSRAALLPNLGADLLRQRTESIGGGWYVSKQSLDRKRIDALIKMLCDVSGLRFGVDVILVESEN